MKIGAFCDEIWYFEILNLSFSFSIIVLPNITASSCIKQFPTNLNYPYQSYWTQETVNFERNERTHGEFGSYRFESTRRHVNRGPEPC